LERRRIAKRKPTPPSLARLVWKSPAEIVSPQHDFQYLSGVLAAFPGKVQEPLECLLRIWEVFLGDDSPSLLRRAAFNGRDDLIPANEGSHKDFTFVEPAAVKSHYLASLLLPGTSPPDWGKQAYSCFIYKCHKIEDFSGGISLKLRLDP